MTHEELLKCGLDEDFVNWLDLSYSGKEYEAFLYLMINRMHLAYIAGKCHGYDKGERDTRDILDEAYDEGYNAGYTRGLGEWFEDEYSL